MKCICCFRNECFCSQSLTLTLCFFLSLSSLLSLSSVQNQKKIPIVPGSVNDATLGDLVGPLLPSATVAGVSASVVSLSCGVSTYADADGCAAGSGGARSCCCDADSSEGRLEAEENSPVTEASLPTVAAAAEDERATVERHTRVHEPSLPGLKRSLVVCNDERKADSPMQIPMVFCPRRLLDN